MDYRAALREPSGVGEYTHELARALLNTRATGGTGVPPIDLTLFSSSWKDRFSPGPELSGASIVDERVPVGLLNLAWHRLGWPPVEAFAPGRFDVVHSMHPLRMPTRDAAQVITIYDLNFLAHPERTRAEIRRDYPSLVADHARRADQVVVISQFTADQVHQRLGVPFDRISICVPGAPPWTPRIGPPPSGGYVLFFGTLEPRKNLGVLLDAYERLARRGARVPPLVLAGKATADSGPWLDRIARAPLAGIVRHIGYVDPALRRSVYEGALMLVQPSFEEGFGLPVLEAMTAGVPVIVTRRGALPEVVGAEGAFMEPDDPDRLAAMIERLAADPEAAAAATARGIERARSFSWATAAHATLNAYRAAIAHRERRRGLP